MKSSQKYSRKDFSLSQYYNQLEKYESGLTNTTKTSLKKEYSLNSFSKDPSKTTNLSKTNHQHFKPERTKLGITDKFASKTSFDKFDRSKLENIKKFSSPTQNFRVSNYLGQSLNNSNITYNQWNNQSRIEKENIPFTSHEEDKFANHCSLLYNIRSDENCVNQIAKQINKRDEVYQVVSQNFSQEEKQKYPQKLKEYFQEHDLMMKIIEQFKSISKLEIKDLNQLYYFLKSDR